MTAKPTIGEFVDKWTAALDAQLRRAGAKTTCPMCGQDDWSLMASADENGDILGWGVPMFRGLSVGGYIPAATLACKACGFVRQHVFRPIDEN